MIDVVILQPLAARRHPANQAAIDMIRTYARVHLCEAVGYSEVARARQLAAARGAEVTSQLLTFAQTVLVLWLDSDMSVTFDTFERHANAVRNTEKAISGRYVKRNYPSELAASGDHTREACVHRDYRLTPVLAGMGALLMPADVFMRQYQNSPPARNGRLICCPRIEEHDGETVMVSEDFDYCRSVPGGVWYAEKDGEQVDYGHVTEVTLYPQRGQS